MFRLGWLLDFVQLIPMQQYQLTSLMCQYIVSDIFKLCVGGDPGTGPVFRNYWDTFCVVTKTAKKQPSADVKRDSADARQDFARTSMNVERVR